MFIIIMNICYSNMQRVQGGEPTACFLVFCRLGEGGSEPLLPEQCSTR